MFPYLSHKIQDSGRFTIWPLNKPCAWKRFPRHKEAVEQVSVIWWFPWVACVDLCSLAHQGPREAHGGPKMCKRWVFPRILPWGVNHFEKPGVFFSGYWVHLSPILADIWKVYIILTSLWFTGLLVGIISTVSISLHIPDITCLEGWTSIEPGYLDSPVPWSIAIFVFCGFRNSH